MSTLRWFQLTCWKFIHCDVTTGADTWRNKAVNRYQQSLFIAYFVGRVSASFQIISRLVGRSGSAVRVSVSFQSFALTMFVCPRYVLTSHLPSVPCQKGQFSVQRLSCHVLGVPQWRRCVISTDPWYWTPVGLLIINTVINYGPPAWWTFSFPGDLPLYILCDYYECFDLWQINWWWWWWWRLRCELIGSNRRR